MMKVKPRKPLVCADFGVVINTVAKYAYIDMFKTFIK